jgi:hypothetical protein
MVCGDGNTSLWYIAAVIGQARNRGELFVMRTAGAQKRGAFTWSGYIGGERVWSDKQPAPERYPTVRQAGYLELVEPPK